jgi:hypothetical protein
MISARQIAHQHRGYRVRWQRFGVVLLLCAVLIACICIVLTQLRPAQAASPLTEVVVDRGDTLWGLASDYCRSDRDLRITVAEIIRINNLASAELQPGQVLLLPGR